MTDRLIHFLAVIILILIFATPPVAALAFDNAAATAAYEKGDYATAMRIWRPLAEQGDASAQARLGMLKPKK